MSLMDVLAGLFQSPGRCSVGLHDWSARRLETLDPACWPTRSEQPHAGDDWRETDNYYVVTGSASLGYSGCVDVCESCGVLHHRRLMRDDATTIRKAKYALDRERVQEGGA